MRNSLLAVTLIAFGATVAVPAIAAQKIERHAFQYPLMQHQPMKKGSTAGSGQHQQMQEEAGKAALIHSEVTTGWTTETAKAAPSETTNGQHQQAQKLIAGKGVTTGSTAETTGAAPSETSGDLAAKYGSMTDSTAGTGPG